MARALLCGLLAFGASPAAHAAVISAPGVGGPTVVRPAATISPDGADKNATGTTATEKPLGARARRLLRNKQDKAAPDPAGAAATSTTTSPAVNGAGTGTGGTTGTGGPGDVQSDRDFNSCKKLPGNQRIVKLNMKPETDINDLISWISSITCKQFLLPGTIPANAKKVTVIAPQLITPDEAYRLFLAAMDSVGLTVDESGRFYKIIETVKAKQTSMPIFSSDAPVPMTESYVKKVVRVDNGDVNEISQVLVRLKSDQGDVVAYPAQAMMIITDTGRNVNSMMKILSEIDLPVQGDKVWLIRVKNSSAVDMAGKLAELFQVAQLGGPKRGNAPPPAGPTPKGRSRNADLATELSISKMIPDERSNSLIVVASEKAYLRLLATIEKLDIPLEGGDDRIHVYYCEHANCDELGQTLGVVTGLSVSGGGSTGRSRRANATPAPAPAAPAGGTPISNSLFEGDVRINFDRPTNSLIILSSLKDYQAVRRVIEMLDSPRKQVFIEAVILEVSLDKTRTLGASFHGGDFPILGNSLGIFGFDSGKTLAPASLLTDSSLLGLAAGVFGEKVAGSASALGATSTTQLDIPAFGVLLRALQTNNDVNVLSSPHLLIMNNEDGEITVGQNVPFRGATFGGGGPAAGGFSFASLAVPVQRQDVALKLKLSPHVNEHDMIRLEVDEEVQDIQSADLGGLGPVTSKRSAKTTVVAKDQQTIVIGGLTGDRTSNTVNKIPILGDIPILGFFFRNSTTRVQKTNILIALTPYVVSDQSDLRRILEKKLKEEREFEERYGVRSPAKIGENQDFRRKRGMLEEINRASKEVAEEEQEEADIRRKNAQQRSEELISYPPASSRPVDSEPAPSGGGMPPADADSETSALPAGGGGGNGGRNAGAGAPVVPPPPSSGATSPAAP